MVMVLAVFEMYSSESRSCGLKCLISVTISSILSSFIASSLTFIQLVHDSSASANASGNDSSH